MSAPLTGHSRRTRPSPVRLGAPQSGGSGSVRPASSLGWNVDAAYWVVYRDRARLRRDRDRLAWVLAVAAAPRWLAVALALTGLVALVLLSGGRP